MNNIEGIDSLSANNTEEAIDKISNMLEENENIDDFNKKLVSSITSVSYDAIRYVIGLEEENYRLEILYETGRNEVESHSLERIS